MKKYLFLVATLLLTVSITMSAQRRGINNRRSGTINSRREQMMRMTPQERVDLMTKELNLTADEATKVLAMCKKHEEERVAQVRDNRSQRGMGLGNRDARRGEFRALRDKQIKEHQEELAQIIGKERADKWNVLRQDVKDSNRAGRIDGGRGYYRNNQQNIDNKRILNTRRSDNMMRIVYTTPKVPHLSIEKYTTCNSIERLKAFIINDKYVYKTRNYYSQLSRGKKSATYIS